LKKRQKNISHCDAFGHFDTHLKFVLNKFDYLSSVTTPVSQFAELPALNLVTVPDLWQQQAHHRLCAGAKTLWFMRPPAPAKHLSLNCGQTRGRIADRRFYTVPTRALANDKLAEWRGRGWDVGIATGDFGGNLGAPVLVATLETQKNRLIQGDGPALLVVDEYQMIRDPDRGLNYELAIALAPSHTQLLLLSGSVANPQDVVKWLQRLGRNAVLIRNDHRPVPLEEVHANNLIFMCRATFAVIAASGRKVSGGDLGPVLIFAPRRQAAESMAAELSRQLPTPNPLQLSTEQKQIVGEHLAKLLKARVAYHHSGLSYAVRAGVIEPLAKAGQLRVVVATMGLAAGYQFFRCAALRWRGNLIVAMPWRSRFVRMKSSRCLGAPDGVVSMKPVSCLSRPTSCRLLDARACQLSRSGAVDWSALLNLMSVARNMGASLSARRCGFRIDCSR